MSAPFAGPGLRRWPDRRGLNTRSMDQYLADIAPKSTSTDITSTVGDVSQNLFFQIASALEVGGR